MASPVPEHREEPTEKYVSEPQVPKNLQSPPKKNATEKMSESASLSQKKISKLSLVPLLSVSVSKNIKKQQKPLEAKQFPIVLGRTNLSQWWYQSCDCQQYYCRLHCRPVAKNIGSLSKVMIQIDTIGTAHIVGKNPHLVTIITPERSNNQKEKTSANSAADNSSCSKGEKGSTGEKEEILEVVENKEEDKQSIILRPNDILSIGRRDSEPWMRFQVIESPAANNNLSSANANTHNGSAKAIEKKSNKVTARETIASGEVEHTEAQRQTQSAQSTNHGKIKTQSGAVAHTTGSPQQRNTHHDARLPEWITTTTTMNNTSGKRSRSSYSYNNYGTTDTKEQQHHQAMVATLTKAAAAAGAAADAAERNRSKKHYRYNNYYNYYNQSNCEADFNAVQRKRRRHNTSSFAPYHYGSSSHNNKSTIRSAEDLFHNGSSRRGGRLQGNHNDPQIHLVFQDYETSARLIQAGTRQGRYKMKVAKESDKNDGSNSNNKHENSKLSQRKHGRMDRNFIGKPNEEGMKNCTTNTSASAHDTNELCNGGKIEKSQSKSMGLLSKNYAAALLEVSNSTEAAPAAVNETAMDNMPPSVVLSGDQGLQVQHHQ